MQDRHSNHRFPASRTGMTLLEILVVIAIITVLTGITLVSSRLIGDARKGASAKQQLSMVAAAINRYAEFWPPWKVVDGATEFRIAEKGWPDFIAGRLFPTGSVPAGSVAFSQVPNFNDLPGGPIFNVPLQEWSLTGNNRDLLAANACLTYALMAKAGKGPYLQADHPNLLDLRSYRGGIPDPLFPTLGGAAESRKILMDPWDVPIRYFWVYRDVESNPSIRAYTGYLPVDYGAFTAENGIPGSIAAPEFHQGTATGPPKVAVGYVLESAGPNKKFGNIWKVNPTQAEIDDASDNVTIKP